MGNKVPPELRDVMESVKSADTLREEDIKRCDQSISNDEVARISKVSDFIAVHIGFNLEKSLKELTE